MLLEAGGAETEAFGVPLREGGYFCGESGEHFFGGLLGRLALGC